MNVQPEIVVYEESDIAYQPDFDIRIAVCQLDWVMDTLKAICKQVIEAGNH